MARSTDSSSERPASPGAITRAYLDYASFSPVDPRVLAVMRPFLEGGADAEGRVDPDAIGRALTPDTALVSIQGANLEIGTIQPVLEIGRILRRRGVAFHVDGVGTIGRHPLAVDECGIDLLSLSSND